MATCDQDPRRDPGEKLQKISEAGCYDRMDVTDEVWQLRKEGGRFSKQIKQYAQILVSLYYESSEKNKMPV